MDSAQRLALYEPLQGFDAERELSESERTLGAQASRPQPFKVMRRGIFRSIDDSQILLAATFHSRLNQSALVLGDKLERLDDHSFAAGTGQILLPLNGGRHLVRHLDVHSSVRGGEQNFAVCLGDFAENIHMPLVIFVGVNGSLARE